MDDKFDPSEWEALAEGEDAGAERKEQYAKIDAADKAGGALTLYRALPEAPEYPVDALGPTLAKAVRAIVKQMQCPNAMAANSVLAVASLAVQARANVLLPVGEDLPAPCSLYFMTVAESGERKSAVDSVALKPVRDVESDWSRSNADEQRKYSANIQAYQVSEKRLQNTLKDDREALAEALFNLGPLPQPPMLSTIHTSQNPTIEGLFRVYQNGRPFHAILAPDGASFLGGFSLSKEQKETTTAALCLAWDGQKLERVRGSEPVINLYDRRLACHFMVQPGVAGEFFSDRKFNDQGLLARFLPTHPTGTSGTRFRDDDAVYREDARQAAIELGDYNRAVERLLRKPVRWKNKDDRALGIVMDELGLTEDARALYVDFYNDIEGRQAKGGDLEGFKAFASKLPEQACRMAGVLARISDPDVLTISDGQMTDAIALSRFYLTEAMRLNAAGYVDPDLLLAQKVYDWMLSGNTHEGMIGCATIYQKGPGAIRSAKRAREIMAILVDNGMAELVKNAVINDHRHREAWKIHAPV